MAMNVKDCDAMLLGREVHSVSYESEIVVLCWFLENIYCIHHVTELVMKKE
jgi:hypothetical protein